MLASPWESPSLLSTTVFNFIIMWKHSVANAQQKSLIITEYYDNQHYTPCDPIQRHTEYSRNMHTDIRVLSGFNSSAPGRFQ